VAVTPIYAVEDAPSERQVLAAVRTLEVPLAWPTIWLTVGLQTGYGWVVLAAATAAIPLWLATLLNAMIAYAGYTPLHEAAHGNVARGRLAWLNHIVGIGGASLLLHNFTMHRTTHLSHHAHLNDPARDADHWVAGQRWWSVLLRCATLVFAHYRMGIRLNHRRIIVRAMAENTLPIAALIAVGWIAGWQVMLTVIVLPALIGATLLGLVFDYVVHAPHQGSARFGATRLFLFPAGLWQIGSWLWLAQNYHLTHHLYPWLPFYRYAAATRAALPLLTARGAPVIQLGRHSIPFPLHSIQAPS
jgi:beta-carotene hydroxylase